MSYANRLMMPLFISSNFTFTRGIRVDREVKYLIEDAREAIAEAKEESKFGNVAMVQILSEEETDQVLLNNLAIISVWHFERGAEKYREAVKYLKIAAAHDLPEKYEKYVVLQIKESEKLLNIALEQKHQVEEIKEKAVTA